MKVRKAVVVLAVAAALVASACSDSDAESSTTSTTTEPAPTTVTLPKDLPDLEFGKGVLPITVPANFPIPVQTTISTTMIDGSRELTEVVMNIGGNIHDVKAFFTVNLPRFDYEVTKEADTTNQTTVFFVGNGIDGNIRLKVIGESVTTGTLSFVYSP